jgi:hypothetical protein
MDTTSQTNAVGNPDVATTPTRAKVATAKTDENAKSITWTFANNHIVTVALAQFPPNIQEYAALHGLKQRLSDCYAGAGKLDNGVANAIEEQAKVIEQLKTGTWAAKAEPGEREEPIDALVTAFHEALTTKFTREGKTPPTPEQVRAKLVAPPDADDATRDQYRKTRAMVRQIREVGVILTQNRKNAPSMDAIAF